MRVVVFGATGNLGTSVLRALGAQAEVHEIWGVARRKPVQSLSKVTWKQADVVSGELSPLVKEADVVIHLAWAIQPSRDRALLDRINVDGSRRVFEACAEAGVGSLVYASSVGAYASAPHDDPELRVSESHSVAGIPSSVYSAQKAEVETILDEVERSHPDLAVARIRPALIFKREAASEIRRYFAGPFLPNALLRRFRPPVVPLPRGLRVQCVHADDAGKAFALAALGRARGAFNVAAEPQLSTGDLARVVGGRPVEVSPRVLRSLATFTWKARLQPTPAGWLDLGMGAPAMDTTRVRSELGWTETVPADEALSELIVGLADGAGGLTPPLDPLAGGRFRGREIRSGIGARP